MQGQIHGIVGTVYGLYTINTVRTVILCITRIGM